MQNDFTITPGTVIPLFVGGDLKRQVTFKISEVTKGKRKNPDMVTYIVNDQPQKSCRVDDLESMIKFLEKEFSKC